MYENKTYTWILRVSDGALSAESQLAVSVLVAPPPTSNPDNLANNNTMTTNSQNFKSDHPIEHLWDTCLDGTAECTSGNIGINSFWVEFDLGQLYDLTQARLFGDANGSWWSSTWTLQYKENQNDVWQIAFSDVNAKINDWVTQNLNIQAQFVRVTINGNPTNGDTQARELEIYGTVSVSELSIFDLNGDNKIDLSDIIIIFKNFKQSFDQEADVNQDGKVNLFDVVKVARHVGEDVR